MKFTITAVAVLLTLAALGYVGWSSLATREASACTVCDRPLHGASAVWAVVDGNRRHFCCAACAIWAERQTGADVEITQVSDYLSDDVLDPSEATFVVGSNVNHCLQQHSVFDPSRTALDLGKEPGSLEFDRCSPSVLAFGSRAAAAQFAEQQGGRLYTVKELRQGLP